VSRAVGPALVALALVASFASSRVGWDHQAELLFARATGWSAALALLASLATTPAERLLRIRLRGWRRRFGLVAATLAAAHAVVALTGRLEGAWAAVVGWPHLRAGALALGILFALALTSSPRLTRALRVRAWKPLHRLVYAAGALAWLHVYRGAYAPRFAVLLFGALLLLALGLRLIPRRTSRS